MSEYPEEAELDVAAEAQAASDEDGQAEPYERRYVPNGFTLGEVARRRRELLGVTQEELAEKFGGPSVTSLWTIENGQSDSYRAKTLFSLDSALAWPRGASMALLRGSVDRISPDYLRSIHFDNFSRNNFSNELDAWDFDHLIEILVESVSDADMIKYDMQIRSASTSTLPAEESISGHEDQSRDDIGSTVQVHDQQPRSGPVANTDDINGALAAMMGLSTGDLEKVGRFAINFARLIRQFQKSTAKISIGGEELTGIALRKYLLDIAMEMAQDGEEVANG